MALKDILNSGKYADDMVLALPDGTSATVGEMRALEAEERTALLQRSQILEKAEMELANRINIAHQRGQLNPKQEERQDATVRAAAAAEFGLDESDPLLGNIVKEFKRLESDQNARLTALQTATETKLKEIAGVTAKATGAYLQDFYSARFDASTSTLPADIRKKVDLESAIKYASENRMMDSVGRLDINSAVDRLTWDARKEHEMSQIKTQAAKDAEKQIEMARMNRPSPSALRTQPNKDSDFSPLNKEGKVKSLDEVLADAANDENLWNSVALTASGFGPN